MADQLQKNSHVALVWAQVTTQHSYQNKYFLFLVLNPVEKHSENALFLLDSNKFMINAFSLMMYCKIIQLHDKINFNNFISGYSLVFINSLKI